MFLTLAAAGCTGAPSSPSAKSPKARATTAKLAVEGAVYELANACSGEVLDVAGASLEDGAPAIQWPDHGGLNQQWKVLPTSGGFFKLISQNDGKALDVAGGGTADGVIVQQWADVGNDNQQWSFTDVGNGFVRLTPRHAPNMALDVSGASTAAGARVQIWSANGTCAQQWKLLPQGSVPGPVCNLPSPPRVNARDHLDSWGVNFTPGSSAVDVAAARLHQIGVHRIRGPLVAGGTSNLSNWQALQAAMGAYRSPALRFDDLITAYNNDLQTTWDGQQNPILAAASTGLLSSIEGPNEMNNFNVGNGSHGVNQTSDQTGQWAGPNGNVFQWASAVSSWKAGLTGGDAQAMSNVAVFAPSIASGDSRDYASLPDLSSLVTNGNVHYYSSDVYQPSLEQGVANPGVGYFANVYQWCQAAVTPGRPLILTEYGASTFQGGYTPHAQAAYLLNQMHDAAGIGAKEIYAYTLVDPSTGSGGNEGNFGIFQTDLSDKPISVALAALKNLFALQNNYDDPSNNQDTAPFTPAFDGCGMTVTGLDSGSFSSRVADAVVYPKSDGSTVISVTNQPPLTDGNSHDVVPTPVTATVHLGSSQSWHLYDVLSATPLTPVSSGTGAEVQVQLMGYPLYLVLDPPPAR